MFVGKHFFDQKIKSVGLSTLSGYIKNWLFNTFYIGLLEFLGFSTLSDLSGFLDYLAFSGLSGLSSLSVFPVFSCFLILYLKFKLLLS